VTWYGLRDAARWLGVRPRTLLAQIRVGRVHARLAGNRWWISRDERSADARPMN
jgi:hypothetical protein